MFGKTTSPTTPSASCWELRISSSQLRFRRSSPGARSLYGFLYLFRHASKSSRYAGSRYSRYVVCDVPAWLSDEMIVKWSVGAEGAVAVIGDSFGH